MERGNDNQDIVCDAHNDKYHVISLSDGVSNCNKARKGAEIACQATTDLLLKKGNYFLNCNEEQTAELLLSHILYELRKAASENSADVEEYSSTISSVLIDKKNKRMLCINLGDSIIISVSKGNCSILAMPSDNSYGCCVTTTIGAATQTTVKLLDTDTIESVVICSDGAWQEMFNRNRLKQEVFTLLIDNDYDGVKEFLKAQNCFDDHSFIAIDMQQVRRRSSA